MDVFDVVDDSGALYEDTSFDITERQSTVQRNTGFAQTEVENPHDRSALAESSENPLKRSLRSNAMMPTPEPIKTSTLKSTKSRSSMGLNKSTYVRDAASFTAIKTDIASGASKY